jgi:hypothetical protein
LTLTAPSIFQINEPLVSAPTFNPDGGAHPGDAVNVTVSCATEDAIIRYTTDGAEPTETSPTVISGEEVVIASPGTLKAKAWSGVESSDTKTSSYTRQEIDFRTVNMSFAGLGVGELSSEPSGIDCYGTNGDSCSGAFDPDSEVILIAFPELGSIFTEWGGDCDGAFGSVCTLFMDGDKNVQANFILQGQANPIGDIRVVNLTPEERELFMNIADGERQFPIDSSIESVFIQNKTATIDYRDGDSQAVIVKDGEGFSEDFINLVLLNGNSAGEIFATLLELPSFEARVNSEGDLAQLYYPGIIPIDGSPSMLVVDLALLKLKSVGQPSIFFRYRENAEDAIMDGDFWITEHLQDTILLPGQTIDPGKMVDLYLVVKDNGLYDLDGTNEIIVDPLVLGVIQEEPIPPSPFTDTSATGSGGGGCFIGTLTDRLF